jgi:hypothetical protein
MLNIDPKVAFYLGLVLCVTQIIGNGGETFLSGAIPAIAVPFVIKWCLIVSAVGTAVMTYIAGGNMTTGGRITNASAAVGVKGLQVTPDIAAVAREAAGSNATITTTKP